MERRQGPAPRDMRRGSAAVTAMPPLPAPLATGQVAMAPETLSEQAIASLSLTRECVREHRLVAAREAVESALAEAPASFTCNAVHGEVLYRLGLYREASAALFTAMLQPPTTWANYQLVSHLYQESRARERGSFVRTTEVPPPAPVERAIRWMAWHLRFLGRLRRLEATG